MDGIPEKWDPGPGTLYRKWTLCPGPGTHYAGPGTHHAGPGTRDPRLCIGTGPFVQDPGHTMRDPGPIMRDPGPGTLDEKYILQTKFFF